MRKFIAIVSFMILFKISNGQDSEKRFEFGSTIITVNSFSNKYFSSDRPSYELINGLFFRYTKKRLGLRVLVNYSDNSFTNSFISDVSGGLYGIDLNNKDLRIGFGSQFSILKQKDWFYTCIDISYRYLYTTGRYYGLFNEKLTSTSNGADCFIGLGFKIKVIRNFNISPEAGWIGSIQFINGENTPTDKPVYNSNYTDKYSATQLNLIPVLKLHLTAKF